MRRTAVLAGLAAAAVAAVPAAHAMDMGGHGATATVPIQFAAFATPQVDIVAGDTVHWRNDSVRAHDVRASDGSFDSGRLPGGDTYDRRFDADGTYAYYCSLHPFMTGEIDVHDVLLSQSAGFAGSGKPFVLAGRAAAGVTGTVTIEGDDGSGAGYQPAATATVADDGTFRAAVVPKASTTYRAVADAGQTSPAVTVRVLDHTVSATVRRGAKTTISVHVEPADPGAPVILQLRLRERFGWWRVAHARLDKSSNATFTVRRHDAVPARVLLTLPDGWTELARSATIQAGPWPVAPRVGSGSGLGGHEEDGHQHQHG